jgi:uncharacterized Fe-S center protein
MCYSGLAKNYNSYILKGGIQMKQANARFPLNCKGKLPAFLLAVLLTFSLIGLPAALAGSTSGGSTVYMTKDISPAGLMAAYKALGREASGKVAVKVHMGEPGGENFLSPDLIKDFVLSVNGTFVDCNTAYGGRRASTAMHLQAAQDHGFTAVAPVDIMDADGTIKLPVAGGKHLKEDVVGSHFENYDFFVILSHFKGHEMGGFGGAIKNMSIGIASKEGKCLIHTAGKSSLSMWGGVQDDFLESMAEAAKAVADDMGDKILYISVMNNISIDCDCNPNPAKPDMHDIGILASLDPVALDQACVDLIYAAEDGKSVIQRIESRNGVHTLDYGEQIGLGSKTYTLVSIDD